MALAQSVLRHHGNQAIRTARVSRSRAGRIVVASFRSAFGTRLYSDADVVAQGIRPLAFAFFESETKGKFADDRKQVGGASSDGSNGMLDNVSAGLKQFILNLVALAGRGAPLADADQDFHSRRCGLRISHCSDGSMMGSKGRWTDLDGLETVGSGPGVMSVGSRGPLRSSNDPGSGARRPAAEVHGSSFELSHIIKGLCRRKKSGSIGAMLPARGGDAFDPQTTTCAWQRLPVLRNAPLDILDGFKNTGLRRAFTADARLLHLTSRRANWGRFGSAATRHISAFHVGNTMSVLPVSAKRDASGWSENIRENNYVAIDNVWALSVGERRGHFV